MPRLPRADRLVLAQRRLRSVLTTHLVANARTLEQKISDAGPNHQRIDPHILTIARRALQASGDIIELPGGPWYHLRTTQAAQVATRLAVLRPLHTQLIAPAVVMRTGQALEIAVFRALAAQAALGFVGHFSDLDVHDDATLYSKEEPPSNVTGRSIPGDKKLDFIAGDLAAPLGIEVKNVRAWLYPDRSEITDLLAKCCHLNAVPVLIARRLPYVTFRLLNPCGVLFHQTFNQRLAQADQPIADLARRKDLLGYHDIRLGNQPDPRLVKFIHRDLSAIAPAARDRFNAYKDLLFPFATGAMSYGEFAARVRRRSLGLPEDSDEDEEDLDEDLGP